MLHHVSLGVGDVAEAAEFYDAVLGALGYKRTAQYLPYAIGYGEGVSEFWIQLPHDRKAASSGNGVHVAFAARTREAVQRFYQAALARGGADEGAPGPRADYGPDYFGAFARDPFGNKIEAMLRPAAAKGRSRPDHGKPVAKPKRRTTRAPVKSRKRKAARR